MYGNTCNYTLMLVSILINYRKLLNLFLESYGNERDICLYIHAYLTAQTLPLLTLINKLSYEHFPSHTHAFIEVSFKNFKCQL